VNEPYTDIQVFGFHGCKKEVKDSLLSHQIHFEGSKNPWDWLGDGIYFWENDFQRALNWAANYHKEEGAVIGAKIKLATCFDLANSVSRQFLPIAYEDMVSLYAVEGLQLPTNINPKNHAGNTDDLVLRFLDRAVMHHLFNTLLPQAQPDVKYGTVRAPFQEGNELYPGSRFFEHDHIQICVRDLACITELFDPEN